MLLPRCAPNVRSAQAQRVLRPPSNWRPRLGSWPAGRPRRRDVRGRDVRRGRSFPRCPAGSRNAGGTACNRRDGVFPASSAEYALETDRATSMAAFIDVASGAWPEPDASPAAKPAINVVSGAAGRTTECAATPARDNTSLTSTSTSSSSKARSRSRHHSSSVSSWLFMPASKLNCGCDVQPG